MNTNTQRNPLVQSPSVQNIEIFYGGDRPDTLGSNLLPPASVERNDLILTLLNLNVNPLAPQSYIVFNDATLYNIGPTGQQQQVQNTGVDSTASDIINNGILPERIQDIINQVMANRLALVEEVLDNATNALIRTGGELQDTYRLLDSLYYQVSLPESSERPVSSISSERSVSSISPSDSSSESVVSITSPSSVGVTTSLFDNFLGFQASLLFGFQSFIGAFFSGEVVPIPDAYDASEQPTAKLDFSNYEPLSIFFTIAIMQGLQAILSIIILWRSAPVFKNGPNISATDLPLNQTIQNSNNQFLNETVTDSDNKTIDDVIRSFIKSTIEAKAYRYSSKELYRQFKTSTSCSMSYSKIHFYRLFNKAIKTHTFIKKVKINGRTYYKGFIFQDTSGTR